MESTERSIKQRCNCIKFSTEGNNSHLIPNGDVGALSPTFSFSDLSILAVGDVGDGHTSRQPAVLQNDL